MLRVSCAVPKGWTKAKRAAAERGEWKAMAPRVENIAMIVLAALEGFVFLDAAPVSRLVLEKVYAGTQCTVIAASAFSS